MRGDGQKEGGEKGWVDGVRGEGWTERGRREGMGGRSEGGGMDRRREERRDGWAE